MAVSAIAIKEEPEDSAALEDRIRQRAHEIYLQRAGEDGSAVDDWLQAEAEILQTKEI